jgi:DNA mismatch repair protein MutS
MPQFTPMLRQYRELKVRFPDAILLFRLGDFYEMFEDDARVASRELELVLTSRRFSKSVRLPMCGVPCHNVTSYIARLIERGHKVAVVEQLEDARQVKRLVKRDVVRVITPGTVVEDALLQDKAENFLAAICHDSARRGGYGLAVVDLSTGEFATTQTDGPDAWASLLEELGRLQPSEVVLPASLASDERLVAHLGSLRSNPARISPLDECAFALDAARRCLMEHFGVASLEAYGCDGLPLATAAAGAVLRYLKDNQLSDLAHIRSLRTYSLADYMILDSTTRRNLELTETLRQSAEGRRDRPAKGSLLSVLDRTLTAMGARLLRRWINQPLLDLARIQGRLDAIEELVNDAFLRADLRNLLNGLYDMERLVGRIGFGNANARDLAALKKTLRCLPSIKALLGQTQAPRLRELYANLDESQDVADVIERAIVDDPPILLREGQLIKPGYHEGLDQLRRSAEEGRAWLTELEMRERERTGIKNLRVRYNEVFGFFIEVTRSNLHLVPASYERRATITNAERFVTPELKTREADILSAEEHARTLEYDLFVEVRQQVAAHIARLQEAARILAELDALASLAEVAVRYSYVKPVVDDGEVIEIHNGRHPAVECFLPEGERFVPNDTLVDTGEQRLLVISGPNMSGKSVYIRQVALIALMAQMGSFVPADSARIGLADRIFTRAGATDDISQGRSTFLLEMSEAGHILRYATPRSLIILDEIGRGTSTYDGVSIAWAVAGHIHDEIGARTLFATHYHELIGLADHFPGVVNYSMAVREEGNQVIFLRRLVPGGSDKSYGIHVAKLAGLPERVIENAREILEELEKRKGRAWPQGELLEKGEATVEDRLREVSGVYAPPTDLKPVGGLEPVAGLDNVVWEAMREIYRLDIANMTPVQALVLLNELQQLLRTGRKR